MAATKRPPHNARLQDWLPTVGGLIAVAGWPIIPVFPANWVGLALGALYCGVIAATGAASIISLRSRRRHHLPNWLVAVNTTWLILAIVALALSLVGLWAIATWPSDF